MNIVVCIKQVPEINEVKVNPETGTLLREGVASILNPYCEYALDHAVRIKQSTPEVNITVISMGPLQARAALLRALELGADRAVLVSDRHFAGADTWATALTLSAAIRATQKNFDLILVGKQATDGDTAQVGPEVAEIFGIPQIMYAVQMELTHKGKRLQVKREHGTGEQILESRFPLLVSASKGEASRRLPSFMDILSARHKPLEVLTAKDLALTEDQLGLAGSHTQVVKIFPPQAKKASRKLEGMSPEEASDEIFGFLTQEGFVRGD
jgi:electron transfer flavoprotein beta subunit